MFLSNHSETCTNSYIDNALCRVLDIHGDREVEEVVDGVAGISEAVDGVLPGEGGFVPVVPVEHWPTAEPP